MLYVSFLGKTLLSLDIMAISFVLLLLNEHVLSRDVQISATQMESVLMASAFALPTIQAMTVLK